MCTEARVAAPSVQCFRRHCQLGACSCALLQQFNACTARLLPTSLIQLPNDVATAVSYQPLAGIIFMHPGVLRCAVLCAVRYGFAHAGLTREMLDAYGMPLSTAIAQLKSTLPKDAILVGQNINKVRMHAQLTLWVLVASVGSGYGNVKAV